MMNTKQKRDYREKRIIKLERREVKRASVVNNKLGRVLDEGKM